MNERKPAWRRTLAAASATLAAIAAAALATASTADAGITKAAVGNTASAPAPGQTVRKTARMHIIRVTKLVTSTPDRAGDVTVKLANGAVIAIPAASKNRVMNRAAQEAKSSPDGVVVGNCGSSYIDLAEKSDDHPVHMTTGFTVDDFAIAYGWLAQITGPSYSYTYTAAGTLDFDLSWNGAYSSPDDQLQGTYDAAVEPDGSFAELWDGDICFSGGPTASEFLTSPDTPISMPLVTNGSLRHATPVIGAGPNAPARPSGPGAQSPAFQGRRGPTPAAAAPGADPLTRVTNTAVYPYRAVALLKITYEDGFSDTCTGFFYAPNVVATAGHCLYFGVNGWAESVEVIPGNNVNDEPFGTCQGTTAYTTTGWVLDSSRQYDYGAVKLNCDTGLETGWFGLFSTTAPLTGTNITITGYPVDLVPPQSMWTNSGTIAGDTQRQVFYAIDTRAGESGAPVYMPGCGGYCAIAVHAYAPDPENPLFAGTRISLAAFDNYQLWKS